MYVSDEKYPHQPRDYNCSNTSVSRDHYYPVIDTQNMDVAGYCE
jgi:hypothetical protein